MDDERLKRLQEWGKKSLARHEAEYLKTSNPYWAWMGWLTAQRYLMEPPLWVISYLNRAAQCLENRVSFADGDTTRPAKLIAEALEFEVGDGRGGSVEAVRLIGRDALLAYDVGHRIQKDRTEVKAGRKAKARSRTAIYTEVAIRNEVDLSTVKRAWKAMKHIYEPSP